MNAWEKVGVEDEENQSREFIVIEVFRGFSHSNCQEEVGGQTPNFSVVVKLLNW